MSKYVDLTEEIHAETRDMVYLDEVREVLKWLDRNPGQVPGLTITQSQAEYLLEGAVDHRDRARMSGVGITVIPDHAPTNAEKATADLELWGVPRSEALELGPWLAGRSWTKAPEVDNG